MGLFFYYLKSHRKIIGAFLGFCVIFAVVFALYELPVGAVGYGAVICTFVGLILVVWDYGAFYEKHKRLEALSREITVTTAGLPVPWGPLEKDYQAVIRVLYEDKLQLTDQMRERYTDLVEYYTVWAHQVKTPIAAMGLLLQGEDGDTAHSRELREELQRIEQYVEMVLCYLRLEGPATDYVIREYDLDGILKQAVRKYASQFIRRKIRLEYKPLGCWVLTDEKWLLFVIEQVLSNALKYTRSGTISITLEAPKTLCIRDTGMGIAPEDLPRIFEKGYTGFNGRRDKKASGIGLYLCRRICRNLGHDISASSAPGRGTEIRIDLKSAELETE
ncbi:MAG TPA: HAMP domain-containing histidine kinase [Desulfitobacterium dehalogenans]|uniref:histidine kinase n=1 Tax=Desulfitobacterium dehalogenans TaxID=36854 RepID=A0A7C7D4L8_9FIRM|nr:HAMP domain-containing histidine kinase [Desulfitobacterium dehalogenans]